MDLFPARWEVKPSVWVSELADEGDQGPMPKPEAITEKKLAKHQRMQCFQGRWPVHAGPAINMCAQIVCLCDSVCACVNQSFVCSGAWLWRMDTSEHLMHLVCILHTAHCVFTIVLVPKRKIGMGMSFLQQIQLHVRNAASPHKIQHALYDWFMAPDVVLRKGPQDDIFSKKNCMRD